MATLSEIRNFIEGTEFIGQVQADTKDIESNNVNTVTEGYQALTDELPYESEFSNLLNDPNSAMSNYLKETETAADNYLGGIPLLVQSASGDGAAILMNGDSTTSVATLLDFVKGGTLSVTYTHDNWGTAGSSNANWANGSGLSDTSISQSGQPGDGEGNDPSQGAFGDSTEQETDCESGSASAWASYVVFATTGNDSALNNISFSNV